MPIRRQLLHAFRHRRGTPEFWLHLFLFACLGVAFWPVMRWIAATAHEQSRLFHALVILLFATTILVKFGQYSIRDPLTLNRSAARALGAAFALVGAAFFGARFLPGGPPAATAALLILPGYAFAVAAFALFVFGDGVRRITVTVTVALCAFLGLSLVMGPLDWPLRTLAGKWSGAALGLLGKNVDLGLAGAGAGPPKLILLVDSHPFHVASECNGFGVILTSLLIAILLSVYRRSGVLDGVINCVAALTLGFAFNILRIVIIVLLTPALIEHYQLMHEIVGAITYWGCLVALWLLLGGPVGERRSAARPA